MKRTSLHNHTREFSPCSSISFEKLIDISLERGIEKIAITDHIYPHQKRFSQEKYDKLFTDDFLIKGYEVEINPDIELLVYNNELTINEIKRVIDKDTDSNSKLIDFISLKDDYDCQITLAHPFRSGAKWLFNTDLDILKELIDYIEINNYDDEIQKAESVILAELLNKQLVFGDDIHSERFIGQTEFYCAFVGNKFYPISFNLHVDFKTLEQKIFNNYCFCGNSFKSFKLEKFINNMQFVYSSCSWCGSNIFHIIK